MALRATRGAAAARRTLLTDVNEEALELCLQMQAKIHAALYQSFTNSNVN